MGSVMMTIAKSHYEQRRIVVVAPCKLAARAALRAVPTAETAEPEADTACLHGQVVVVEGWGIGRIACATKGRRGNGGGRGMR